MYDITLATLIYKIISFKRIKQLHIHKNHFYFLKTINSIFWTKIPSIVFINISQSNTYWKKKSIRVAILK